MEINRLTPLDGKTADNLDQLQAASNTYPTDNGGGFLENCKFYISRALHIVCI